MAANNQNNNQGGAQGGAPELTQPIRGGFEAIANPDEGAHGILAANHLHFGRWLTQDFKIDTTIRKIANPDADENGWNY